ncbi:methyl-accepting chemotaxis protein [Marinobacterium stanieri]|uniref:methyl-accepting chemotaxis protein n=1 Tax=Marinobacterium stanieri TaxID=49186 RepID=UPI0002559B93|nr:HAMP domain-containing methyl-accepting chemotaxis protein [Marinobacterium stanieri]
MFSWNLQNIRISARFAIAGLLLVLGIIALATSYYRTIVIDEESLRIGAETRAIQDAVSTLTEDLQEARIAFTRARLSLSPAAINALEQHTSALSGHLERLPALLGQLPSAAILRNQLDNLDLEGALNELAIIKRSTAPDEERILRLQKAFGPIFARLQHERVLRQLLPNAFSAEATNRRNEAKAQMLKLFFASLVLLGLALAIALAIVKYGVLDPLTQLHNTVSAVRNGDNDARAPLDSRDELGQMASVLNNLLDEKEEALAIQANENKKLNDSIIQLIQSVFKISQKDLTVRVPVAEDITGAIADSINQLTDSIENVLHEVSGVTSEVNSTSMQLQEQSETVLFQAGKEQEQINETLKGLDSAIKAMGLIAKLASVSNSTSQKAIVTSENAKESVTATVASINKIRETIHEAEKRIKRLGERSQEIGGIISLINNISERTHILSLNASMHAASAGEAGRGLMVVVDEVQRLSENSREATAEIENLVNNIQLETADTIHVINTAIEDVVTGTRLAEQAGERMEQTRDTTQSLVESVLRIAQNATGQAKLTQSLRERADSINAFTQATNNEMLQQKQLSSRLVDAAGELERSISVFKLQHQSKN